MAWMSRRLRIGAAVLLALACLGGCASYRDQWATPPEQSNQPLPRHAKLCNPDSLRWSTGFVPRLPSRTGAGTDECLTVLDTVQIGDR
jgi:hypothetical protein